MKRLVLALSLACALLLFLVYRTDGFFRSKIEGEMIGGAAALLPDEYRTRLAQPFHYLAKGHQCFVFEGLDGQTVIKFLNYNRFSLPGGLMYFPWPKPVHLWLAAQDHHRRHRFDDTMRSFILADKRLRPETGILYLHVQPGGDLPTITAIDRAHRIHEIDLNGVAFILQKKASPIFDELERRYQMQGKAGLEEGVEAFFALIRRRCLMGIADDDRDVGINFGFADGEAMLLDPGRIYFDERLRTKEGLAHEMKIATKRLRKWLQKHHPESVAHFEETFDRAASF
jgi:hypothetical protein